MVKNLIYFVYVPETGINDYHRRNFELLNKYIDQFDGKIILTVAYKEMTIPPRELFDLYDFKVYRLGLIDNDPVNWEAEPFLDALDEIEDGVTFYAHCKGVTRPPMPGLHTWLDHLYHENLSNSAPLGKHIFSGICAKLLPCPPYVPVPFHYSGSFYWFKTKEVKKRIKELNPTPSRYMTESLPGMIATQDECRFDFYSTTKNENFYKQETWIRILSNHK